MNDHTPIGKTMNVAVATKDNAKYVSGRRAYFKYRDLGATEGTNGFMRAQVTSAEQGMSQPTGWHVHKCQAQLVYMLSGWIDLEFADRKVRIQAGDSIMIPGNTPHNETGTSDTFELLEGSVPADMGTEPCEPPPGHYPRFKSPSPCLGCGQPHPRCSRRAYAVRRRPAGQGGAAGRRRWPPQTPSRASLIRLAGGAGGSRDP